MPSPIGEVHHNSSKAGATEAERRLESQFGSSDFV
jgi:hypothetical protein